MKSKLCVFDIDDVTLNFLGPLVDLHNKLHGTRISPHQLTNWDFENLVMIDAAGKVVLGSDIRKTMCEYIDHGFLAYLEPFEFVKESIDICQELGYTVCFLTARPHSQSKQTILSLLKHNIKHDFVVYNKNKAWALNELKDTFDIELFVDDNAKYLKELENCTHIKKLFMINRPHNMQEEVGTKVARVHNLMEVVSQLRRVV